MVFCSKSAVDTLLFQEKGCISMKEILDKIQTINILVLLSQMNEAQKEVLLWKLKELKDDLTPEN